MTHIEAFAKELEKEAVTTRKMFVCVLTDKLDWQAHPRSMTVKSLATHIAELPTWIGMVLNTDELDFASNPYSPKDIKNTDELLAYFEECLEDGRKHFIKGQEEKLTKIWTLRNGEIIYTRESKFDFLRQTMSQIIHHRAQLGVNLRLLNVPIPGSYGPSADENF